MGSYLRAALLSCVLLTALRVVVAASAPGASGLLVQTTSGAVQGFLDTNTTDVPLKKWLGVPYADDTSGANRWRPPQPVKVRHGEVINASAYGPACMQGRANGGNGTAVQSEDCLLINIVAPANASNLPVYIYVYGGGYDSGSASDPKVDGSYLAAKGIVFANFGYRLSLWAFPHASEIAEAGETQNFGLLDTRAAVEWLRDNVKQFGGDPTKITLGGESVGAEMTNQYMTAYHEDPIVRAAVMQSADTSQPMWGLNDQISKLASNISCPTGKGLLDCLRTKSATDLQQVLLATGLQFQPVTDNVTIWKDYVKLTRERRTAQIPLLCGTNLNEGTLIVEGEPTAYLPNIVQYSKSNNFNMPWANLTVMEELYPVPSEAFPSAFNASSQIWRDAHMQCLVHNLATERTRVLNQPVWRYRFDLVAANLNSEGVRVGAFHGTDIRFVMGQWRLLAIDAPFIPATPGEIAISNLMVEAWTNFIKDPFNGPQIPGWKQYDPEDTTTLALLGYNLTGADLGDHFTADSTCAFWNEVLPIFPLTFPACGSWTC
ncbi:carboxylesterase [Phanerochaete sordida]|uniref:Carboxylesterase n=1 Tax=Phanerochaete sordida TaxID=48140 RepID=A0A9P3GH35_9APHY|nr:carboxylesterase [Phanerochaete sordida]